MTTTTDAFFEAWINTEHRLLGRKLRPLCLRHLLFLHAIQSPLVVTDKPCTLPDLEVAAIVCGSATDAEALTAFNVQKLSAFEKFRLRIWHRQNLRRDVRKEAEAFLAYQDDFLSIPEVYETEGGTKTGTGLPWLLMHAAALIQATGWGEGEVFNMPVGKIVWLNLAFGYLKTGETSVITDADQEARALLTGALTT